MAEKQPNIDQVAAVTELLTGKTDAAAGTPSAADDTGSGDASPTPAQGAPGPQSGDDPGTDDLTPTILAERLGMTPQALFKQLKIPVDGGDPLSLEDFKGAGKELRDVRDAQSVLAEKRVTFENETMQQRQALQGMLAKIPEHLLTDELVADVQLEQQRYVSEERQALFGVRPDLNDAAKWSSVRQLLIEHLAPYGFRDVEVDGITDHRLAKYVIDNAERAVRVRELEASAEKGATPLAGKKPKPAAQRVAPITRRTAPKIQNEGVMSQKVAEVAKLLGET